MMGFEQLLNSVKTLSPAARRAQLKPYIDARFAKELVQAVSDEQLRRLALRCLCDLDGISQIISAAQQNPQPIRDALCCADAKTRKIAAQAVGSLELHALIDALIAALAAEQTDFVKPSMLLALGVFKTNTAAQEAARAFVPSGEEKHLKEQQIAQQRALSSFAPPSDAVLADIRTDALLICPNTQTALQDLKAGGLVARAYKEIDGSIYLNKVPYKKLFEYRTFYEALIPYSTAHTIEDVKKILSAPHFTDFVCSLFSAPPSYRFEILGVEHTQRKRVVDELLTGIKLINNPSDYALEIRIIFGQTIHILLKPTYADERFKYRKQHIPASIHPAAAAACIKYISPYLNAKANVLDPFCGSGTMLFERSFLPHAQLNGSDISKDAIDCARSNQRQSGIDINFFMKNALTPFEQSFDELICNMPFGLRVGSHGQNVRLYKNFMSDIKHMLNPNGYAFLYTHEKKLLSEFIPLSNLRLIDKRTFSAGGLNPAMFILHRNK